MAGHPIPSRASRPDANEPRAQATGSPRRSPRIQPPHRAPRGAVLLEVLLALALFVTTGLIILSLMGQAADSLSRARQTRRAVDLARSTMSRIEAGIDTPETAGGPVRPWIEPGSEATFNERLPEPTGWTVEVDTEPSAVDGLTWVTATATHRDPVSEAVLATYSLRQAVRLSPARGRTDADVAEVEP